MKRNLSFALICFFLTTNYASPKKLNELIKEFELYSGSKLVFQKSKLPNGSYYDRMPELTTVRKIQACKILLKEVKKYPRNYFGTIGLKTVGVFSACISKTNDGFRKYNKELKGYRYYGMWNRTSRTFVAAFYTYGQLPLTFHHEIFHHVDATHQGKMDYATNFTSDDALFNQAITLKKAYPAPKIAKTDLEALKKKSENYILTGQLGEYASKNVGEDQAETARYFMSALPDSLVQIVEQPELPGSQRIIHVIREYQNACPQGPNVQWFVDVALGKATKKKITVTKPKKVEKPKKYKEIIVRLEPEKVDNPYLKKVDSAISDMKKRKIIRSVQPACVKIGGGSGVNVSPNGLILTAGHVPKKVGKKLNIRFPDDSKYTGTCIAVNSFLDLAIVQIKTNKLLPYAEISALSPKVGSWVACIGQPSPVSPQGTPIPDHTPFYVSIGKISHFKVDPKLGLLGSQKHGRCVYTAWTYWGHSGSPLFNDQGKIVAIHNSWEGISATRNGVPLQAIQYFLKSNKIKASMETLK